MLHLSFFPFILMYKETPTPTTPTSQHLSRIGLRDVGARGAAPPRGSVHRGGAPAAVCRGRRRGGPRAPGSRPHPERLPRRRVCPGGGVRRPRLCCACSLVCCGAWRTVDPLTKHESPLPPPAAADVTARLFQGHVSPRVWVMTAVGMGQIWNFGTERMANNTHPANHLIDASNPPPRRGFFRSEVTGFGVYPTWPKAAWEGGEVGVWFEKWLTVF